MTVTRSAYPGDMWGRETERIEAYKLRTKTDRTIEPCKKGLVGGSADVCTTTPRHERA